LRLFLSGRPGRKPGCARPRRPARVPLQLETLGERVLPSTFYVSPTGNDKNDGLAPATAWQTIAKVNQGTFRPGDSILFKGGATFSGGLTFTASSAGTSAAPINVSSYGSGRATILAGRGFGLYALDTAGFNVTNLNFVGTGANTSNGIRFCDDRAGGAKLQHVYVDHVDVSGFGEFGIDVGTLTSAAGYNDVRITYAVAHGNGGGVFVWGQTPSSSNSNVYIGHCIAYENAADGLEIADTDGGTIERSIAHDNGRNVGGEVGIWTYDSTHVTIQYNESYHNRSTPTADDGDGFDFDGGVTNSVMQYNYSHDNDGAGFLVGEYPGSGPTTGNVIRYNISQNDGQLNGYGGIYLYNYNSPTTKVTGNFFYNNTLYNSSGGANVVIDGDLTGSVNVFANNIFQTANGVPLIRWSGKSGATFVGNDYWSSGGSFLITHDEASYFSLSAFRGSGQEILKGRPTGYGLVVVERDKPRWYGDPQLNYAGGGGIIGDSDRLNTLRAYRLRPTSVLTHAGLNLQSIYGVNPGSANFYGNPVPRSGPWNVGAD
jgi:hypothetical protein